MAALVFDVGGTTTRAGLFDCGQNALIRSVSRATPNHLDFPGSTFPQLRDALLDLMERLSDELSPRDQLADLAVAFAGPIDPAGRVMAAPTLWGDRLAAPYALRHDLMRRWPRARVRIMNDVTAAGYRYLRGSEDFCIVTVSSGIGNKVFAQGRPLVGPKGAGGELGHLRVDESPDAPVCECGGRGHLGAIASGRGVLAYARRVAPHLTSGDLAVSFRRGESWAMRVVAHGAAPLGWALAAMHLGLGIERFVLVGGFALALGESYRAMVAAAAAERCWDGTGVWDHRVELGIADDHAGLIGAGIAVGVKP